MSTIVDIYFPERVIDDEFFEALDNRFGEIGFQVGKSSGYRNSMALVHSKNSDLVKIDHWPPTDSIPKKSEQLSAEYSPGAGQHFSFFISIFYTENCYLNRIIITSSYPPNASGSYSLIEIEMLCRLQHVSVLLFNELKAIEMNCRSKYGEDYIFNINDTEEKLSDFSKWELDEAGGVDLEFTNWCVNPDVVLGKSTIEESCTPYSTEKSWKAKVPINFDKASQVFYLRYVDEKGMHKKALLRYCLTAMSGARLYSKSKSDELFYNPTKEEFEKFQSLSWKAASMEDIQKILGDPDFTLPPILYDDKYKAENYYDVTKQNVYTNISETSVVIFQEYENHMILVLYAGKEKEGLN